ncbi:thioredoxin TrxC [Pseudomarimonas arenosa]|uniref:Thioredoxin n=1 Tax=Pseudomarimonas arenosa TaxID=2774145 RepID=A0AAW3ZFP8_9GAMM|nr:thioredoxin TrxC [Pseudomarimonas arenosa]MBD8524866.1 thioredoxin TrxC [Pseudomarimonas arenosa]
MSDDELLLLACPHCHTLNRFPQAKLEQHPSCGRCHKAMFAGEPFALDADNFDAHAQRSDLPLLVDFWAPWCGPCLAMAPAFAQAAQTLEPWVHLAKVDTQAVPQLGAQFGIRSIPTMILFHQGQELARQSGAMPAGQIVQFAQRALHEHFS